MKNREKSEFWFEFVKISGRLAELIHARRMREAFEIVEAILELSDSDFAFELTEDRGLPVLVLTPEGDTRQAKCIDDLLAGRPEVPGWIFHGRRQRKEYKDVLTFVRYIHGCDVSDVMFGLRQSDVGYEITVITMAMAGLTEGASYGLAATLLDHALGEDAVMSKVSSIRGAIPAEWHESVPFSLAELIDCLGVGLS